MTEGEKMSVSEDKSDELIIRLGTPADLDEVMAAAVAAVAERNFAAALAATQHHGLVFLLGPNHRLHGRLGRCVGAIAEGLLLGQTAGTPRIAVSLQQFDLIGAFLGDDRFFFHFRSYYR